MPVPGCTAMPGWLVQHQHVVVFVQDGDAENGFWTAGMPRNPGQASPPAAPPARPASSGLGP